MTVLADTAATSVVAGTPRPRPDDPTYVTSDLVVHYLEPRPGRPGGGHRPSRRRPRAASTWCGCRCVDHGADDRRLVLAVVDRPAHRPRRSYRPVTSAPPAPAEATDRLKGDRPWR